MTKRAVEKKLASKRAVRTSRRDACPLCRSHTQWKPSVLKSIEDGVRLSNDLAAGRVTREELIRRGELMSFEEFIQKMHEGCSYVSCQ